MGLRTLSFESILSPPRRRGPKRSSPRPCDSCGGTTNYEVCAACTDRGINLAVLFATYDEMAYNPISPIPEDIYTVLAIKGTQTFEGLATEVNIENELLDIYTKRLMKCGTVIVYDRRDEKRGSVKKLVALTDEGKRVSRAYRIIRDFEDHYGELARARSEPDDEDYQSMAG